MTEAVTPMGDVVGGAGERASPSPTEMAALQALVRRVVGAKVGRHPDAEDLVQETLTRVLAAHARIADGMLEAYTVRTAQNVIATMFRQRERHQRYQPRLVELPRDEQPDDLLVAAEADDAILTALASLSPDERQALISHEVVGVDTTTMAESADSTPAAVAAQLHRTRARMRVEYVIALEGREPPTPHCRRVLLALSSADRRRQHESDAAGHLLSCTYCRGVSPRLTGRAVRQRDEIVVPIEHDADVVTARQAVRRLAERVDFSTTDLTLIATAVSEIARNIVRFAGRGAITATVVEDPCPGVSIEARDVGPGIADVALAMADGYSTYDGLGLGLPGSRRLMDEFEIVSEVGTGTVVTMTKWQKRGIR